MSETIKIYPPRINSLAAARTYSKAFAGEPWNEMFKNKDGEFFPRYVNGQDLALAWKRLGLERAYPLLATGDYINTELKQTNSVFVEIPSQNRALACGWGYSFVEIGNLIDKKWSKASPPQRWELEKSVRNITGVNGSIWYLSEVFVDPNEQTRGLGTKVAELLIANAPANEPIIMRTNANSPMTVIAQNMGMQQILGPKTYRNGTGEIVVEPNCIGMTDPINPDRVLYYLPPKKK